MIIASLILVCVNFLLISLGNISCVFNNGILLGIHVSPYEIFFIPVLLLFLLIIAIKSRNSNFRVFIGVIIIGGLGNLVEKYIFGGSVCDYIQILSLPRFNINDIVILSGIIGLSYENIRLYKKGE
jgi:lipoprotein signal peptidase